MDNMSTSHFSSSAPSQVEGAQINAVCMKSPLNQPEVARWPVVGTCWQTKTKTERMLSLSAAVSCLSTLLLDFD